MGGVQEQVDQQTAITHGEFESGVQVERRRPTYTPFRQSEPRPPALAEAAVIILQAHVTQGELRTGSIEVEGFQVTILELGLQLQFTLKGLPGEGETGLRCLQ